MNPPSLKHILIIEDSTDLQDLLFDLFEAEGYSLSQAFNGRQALELLRSMAQLPTVILLDLMMPVMDGLEFRQEQQKDQRLAPIPVVVLTADTNTQTKTKLGVVEVFRKPIHDMNRFLQVIERASSSAS